MHAVAEDNRLLHSIPAARVALIERIARAASGGGGRSGLRQRFLRNYFHGVAEEDLAERTPRQLARAARPARGHRLPRVHRRARVLLSARVAPRAAARRAAALSR